MKPHEYPAEVDSRSPLFLRLMADMETGADQPEPHELPADDESLPALLRKQAA